MNDAGNCGSPRVNAASNAPEGVASADERPSPGPAATIGSLTNRFTTLRFLEAPIGTSTLLAATACSLVALGIEYYVVAIAYPAFGMTGEAEFPAIHALHSERITYVIGPALLGAFAANALLVGLRPRGVPLWLPAIAAVAGALVLGYTAFVAVPLHAKLAGGYDAKTIASLNATEWFRAVATFAQAAIDVAMLSLALEAK